MGLPAPAWRGLYGAETSVGEHDESGHNAAVGAARNETWTLNQKPATVPHLTVVDTAYLCQSFVETMGRLSCALRDLLELV